MFGKLLDLNLKHKWIGLLIALVVSAVGFHYGKKLPVRLSLADLLPSNRQSVLDLQSVAKEVGGVGYLVVVVGPVDQAPERFLPAIAKGLEGNPNVRYVFYEKEPYLLQDKALYLLPKNEFNKLMKSAKTLFSDGNRNAFDLGLDDEGATQERLQEAREFFKKIKNDHLVGGTDSSSPTHAQYFLSKDGKYAMLLAKPTFDSEDLEQSTKLVAAATDAVKMALPADVPFRLVGRYVDKVNDVRQIEKDISTTGLFGLLAISAVLILGLGTVRGSIATVVGVTLSLGWTMGFAYFAVGQINILTGFLLAILGGLGVEYGIHLIRRYQQERDAGSDHQIAVRNTYLQMSRTLLSAALTSAGAFLILSFSDFRGFSELGKIAGFGVLSIYAVYMLCFPLMSQVLPGAPRFNSASKVFGFYPFGPKWKWSLVPFAIVCAFGLTRAEFEYDFERMHDLSKDTVKLNHLVTELFGRSLTPAALLAQDKNQAVAVKRWIEDPSRSSIVQEAVSLGTLVAEDMHSRRRRLDSFERQLANVSDEELLSKTGIEPKLIRKWLAAAPYTREDLPPQLRDAFGAAGNIVLVYPKENLDKADALRRFSDLLQNARDSFPGLKIGSDARLFMEIFDHVVTDGRIVLVMFLIGAFFVLWLDFRRVKDALALVFQLILGMLLLVALMGLVDVRFSILNVAMIPAVLAAGVDMGVHVRHRENEGFGSLSSAWFVAQAVQISALTTILGFGSLFIAQAGILKGIAWVSVLGQVSMYLVCMVIWPIVKTEILPLFFRKSNQACPSSFAESAVDLN